jgi:hypothetical protein
VEEGLEEMNEEEGWKPRPASRRVFEELSWVSPQVLLEQ